MNPEAMWQALTARIQELERQLAKARKAGREQRRRADLWRHRALTKPRAKR